MIKTITKIGNSQGIIFDSTLLQLSHLKVGDEVNVEVHPGGTITITPMKPQPTPAEFSSKVEDVMQRYARTMKRLA
jgi:antitoxin component of MazEF toxin-antitoxin module